MEPLPPNTGDHHVLYRPVFRVGSALSVSLFGVALMSLSPVLSYGWASSKLSRVVAAFWRGTRAPSSGDHPHCHRTEHVWRTRRVRIGCWWVKSRRGRNPLEYVANNNQNNKKYARMADGHQKARSVCVMMIVMWMFDKGAVGHDNNGIN